MRTAELIRATLAIAVVAVTAAGCSQSTEGTATGQGSASTSLPADFFDIYNPCTEFTDQQATAAGLDAASKSVTTDAKEGDTAWRVCQWRSADNQFFVSVFSTVHTLDEARNKQSLINKVEATIGGRAAQVAQEDNDLKGCYVSMEAEQGMFEIGTRWTRHGKEDRPICEASKEFAIAIEPHLPK